MEHEAEQESLAAVVVEASSEAVMIVAEDASVDAAGVVAATVISEVADEAIGTSCDAAADVTATETVTGENTPVYQNKCRTQRAAGKRWRRKRGEVVTAGPTNRPPGRLQPLPILRWIHT